MNKALYFIKRIFIWLLIVFMSLNTVLASNKYGKNLDKYTISSDLVKSNLYLLNGDFVVVGDSYAYLLVENTKDLYHYVVRPGYNITRLYFELLPRIKSDTFKYAFLFIGPNDYMEQLEPNKFKFVLGLFVDELIKRGIKVVMTDYINPHADFIIKSNLINAKYSIDDYNMGVREIIIGRNLLYVPMDHLIKQFGYNSEFDLVHPNKLLYEPLLAEVIDCINKDKILQSEINNK